MTCTHGTSSFKKQVERGPRTGFRNLLILLFPLIAAVSSLAQATFNSLGSFDGGNGANPYYVYLVQGTDGNFYGTTSSGGANSEGTIFNVSPAGDVKTLYSFCSQSGCSDGEYPAAGLLLAANGDFYGVTVYGGNSTGDGTVFEMTPAHKLTTLYDFSGPDGATPYVDLIQAGSGILYGTTSGGGTSGFAGTIFQISESGSNFKSLASFDLSDGEYPDARLAQGANGNFYAPTYYGNNVYEINAGGKLTSLGLTPGSYPTGALVLANDGNFYGTTSAGGLNDSGSIYRMTPSGKFKLLYSFCAQTGCPDGSTPWAGLIQATDGNLYGTTSAGGANGQGGTVFSITLTGTLTTLYSFCSQSNCADGSSPYEGLLEATSGILYGATYGGGSANLGTVYSISTGLTPFVATVQPSGKVASSVTILGTSLTGATSVSFNGTPATFTVNKSGTDIATSVPAGATTGLITVTTRSSTLETRKNFLVTPQILSFTPPSGPVGTVVTITGVSLTQTTKVTFGGVAATTFTVNSDTEVTATVPTGAKTGKIVITTPGGTATSATSFTVT